MSTEHTHPGEQAFARMNDEQLILHIRHGRYTHWGVSSFDPQDAIQELLRRRAAAEREDMRAKCVASCLEEAARYDKYVRGARKVDTSREECYAEQCRSIADEIGGLK